MSHTQSNLFTRFWSYHTRFVSRFSGWIVAFFVLLSGCAVYYAVNHIGVNSNTADMFDSSLAFRSQQNKFNAAFPLTRRNLIVVVQGPNPEATDSLTNEFASRLRSYPSHFKNVYEPGGDDFFAKNQLLFLSTAQIDTLSQKLARSQVLFSLLSQNYSLRGFFAFIDQVLSTGSEQQISKLNQIFGEANKAIQARLRDTHFIMSWQRVMTSKDLARNQQFRFIEVRPQYDYSQLMAAKPAIESMRGIINDMHLAPDASIRITGEVAMGYEELKSVMSGTIIAGILAFLLVGITLWIGLRSFRLIVSSILTLLVGLSLTFGFSAIAVGQLNMISVAFAILYIGLGIDYAIHFSLKFNELMYAGAHAREALRESFYGLSSTLLLSSISTALGFYAFVPTSFSGVSELGLIAGTGMFVSFFATFTFLPALLSLFYREPHQTSPKTLSAPFAEAISDFQANNARVLRWASIGIAILSIGLVFEVKFDYNPINLRNPKTESVATMNTLLKSDAFTPWTVEFTAGDSASAVDQARKLRKKESVGRVTTLFSFIPKSQPAKLSILHSLQPRYENIPPTHKDSASLILGNQIQAIRDLKTSLADYHKKKRPNMQNFEHTLGQWLDTLSRDNLKRKKRLILSTEHDLLKTFPATLHRLQRSLMAKKITRATIPRSIRKRWKSADQQFRVEVTPAPAFDKNNQTRRTFAAAIQKFNPEATGNLITIMKSGDAVKNAFIQAMSYAFIVITLLLLIYLRSVRDTLYVLLPITLAGTTTCAVMVLLGLHFNFANIIALPLLFGLGVDNGIHIVHQAKHHTNDSAQMLKTSTARAIFFSALTTLFSFGNLAFSPHRGMASMGLILTFGLIFILLTTLLILPVFLMNNTK